MATATPSAQTDTSTKTKRRWVTDHHIQVATKIQPRSRNGQQNTSSKDTSRTDSQREDLRCAMVTARARARRLPWAGAGLTVVTGMLGWGVSAAFGLLEVPAPAAAGVVAALPLIIAVIVVLHTRTSRPQWRPDLALAGLASAAITFWIGATGPSWASALVLLLTTIGCGSRWWRAHPVGPLVPALTLPEDAPLPVTDGSTAPAECEVDEIARRWAQNLAGASGRIRNSRLTNRQVHEHTTTYDVELWSGQQTATWLATVTDAIASGLGLSIEQVITEQASRGADGFRPADRARLTVVTKDPVAEPRYYPGPQVTISDNGQTGVITNLARYRDGKGEARLTMWNKHGMIPTSLFGSTGGGKSAAANLASCGALSTGIMNQVYVDFKGNSSSALRKRARIALIGEDAALQAPRLIKAIIDARGGDDPADQIYPSAERPGWMVLLDELTIGMKSDPKFASAIARQVNIVRSLGIWMVGMSQSMHESSWGGDWARSAFTKQAVSFYMSSKSGDTLIDGLTYSPRNLPTFDEEEAADGEAGQPVPGFAVHVKTDRSNVPALWDWLPNDDMVVDPEPPWRTSSAMDEFFRQPELYPADYEAVVKLLGEPVDGRWVVGPGGTHRFPEPKPKGAVKGAAPAAAPVATGFGLVAPADPAVEDLTPTQRQVLAIIKGGTTRTGDIGDAVKASPSTLHTALNGLVGRNLIHRAGHGEYQPGPN